MKTNKSKKIQKIVFLATIICIGSNFTQIKASEAASVTERSPIASASSLAAESRATDVSELPAAIGNAVLKNLSSLSGLPTSKLRIARVQKQQWRDMCTLGLGGERVGCPAESKPGWQVTVVSDTQRWVYRTNSSGSVVLLDEAASQMGVANLPSSIVKAVMQDASRRAELPTSQLRITQAVRKNWIYGCEVPQPGYACDPVVVSGWQVTVAGGEQRLVYLTERAGSYVKLDEKASQIGKRWKTFTSSTYGVTLQYPSNWKLIQGYDQYNTRHGGSDGFFQLSAINSERITLQALCQGEANHRLKPYGSRPRIERLKIQGQDACFIWPSSDQNQGMMNQAALIVSAPRQITISGERYNNVVLWADKNHIREIAKSLKLR